MPVGTAGHDGQQQRLPGRVVGRNAVQDRGRAARRVDRLRTEKGHRGHLDQFCAELVQVVRRQSLEDLLEQDAPELTRRPAERLLAHPARQALSVRTVLAVGDVHHQPEDVVLVPHALPDAALLDGAKLLVGSDALPQKIEHSQRRAAATSLELVTLVEYTRP
jgi:hypothetical protein